MRKAVKKEKKLINLKTLHTHLFIHKHTHTQPFSTTYDACTGSATHNTYTYSI